uniref:Uncharacterized protein n=1 Tax=Ditylenchus dipsaci TaxID=166011 RepID=A0A915EBD9_9BILA
MEVFEHCSKIELQWQCPPEKRCPPMDFFTTNSRFLHCNSIHIADDTNQRYACYHSLLEWLHWPGCSSRKLFIFENYGSSGVESFLQKVKEKFECSQDQRNFTVFIDSDTIRKKEAYCLLNTHVSQKLIFFEMTEKVSRYDQYRMERCSI